MRSQPRAPSMDAWCERVITSYCLFGVQVEQAVFLILNVPLYWSNFLIMLAAFFFVPWFTVLIVSGASLLAGAPFTMILRRWNRFLRLLTCYVTGAIAVWLVLGIL